MVFALSACGGISQAEHDRLKEEVERLENELRRMRDNTDNGDQGTTPSPFASVSVGDVIQFGALDWRVLDVQDGKALILSERIVTQQRYHSYESITWDRSEIREWLNGSFIENTFTAEERGHIAESRITNENNPNGTSGGISTIDHVFLLSIDEAQIYFADNEARIARNATNTASRWWLRSPGYRSNDAANVYEDGYVDIIGRLVDNASGGVRPALWLDITS
jgi:hypothetical protein